jgi:hypothetical protein
MNTPESFRSLDHRDRDGTRDTNIQIFIDPDANGANDENKPLVTMPSLRGERIPLADRTAAFVQMSNKRDKARLQRKIRRAIFNIGRAHRRLRYHILDHRELKREYYRLLTRTERAHCRAARKFKHDNHRSNSTAT